MADITQDRVYTKRCGERLADPLAAGALIPCGAMYVLDTDGNAIPAAANSSGPVRGMALRRADAAACHTHVEGGRGIYLFANSEAKPLTRADIRAGNAKVEDCHTVAKDGTLTAGKVIDVTDEGVFVEIGQKW